jgi:hypothetical protein
VAIALQWMPNSSPKLAVIANGMAHEVAPVVATALQWMPNSSPKLAVIANGMAGALHWILTNHL